MLRDSQWDAERIQRDEQRRRANAEHLAIVRQQMESQRLRKRRDRFEPATVDPGRMPPALVRAGDPAVGPPADAGAQHPAAARAPARLPSVFAAPPPQPQGLPPQQQHCRL